MQHIGADMHVAPRAHIADGYNDVLIVRGDATGRCGLTSVLLRQDAGTHLDMPQVIHFKVNEFRLDPELRGVFSIDGEAFQVQPVEGKVLPSHLNCLVIR
jgi:diacylglycerol kinase family enzyme